MKVTESIARKLTITGADSLDPVTVFLEDFGPEQGRITLVCYGESWTAYWGAMGGSLVGFFPSCHVDYVAGKMSSARPKIYDEDALAEMAAQNGMPDSDIHDELSSDHKVLSELFGPDMINWHDKIPKKENHEYSYLCRIIKAAQHAVKSACVEMA